MSELQGRKADKIIVDEAEKEKPRFLGVREVDPWTDEHARSMKKEHKLERMNRKFGRRRGKNRATNYHRSK